MVAIEIMPQSQRRDDAAASEGIHKNKRREIEVNTKVVVFVRHLFHAEGGEAAKGNPYFSPLLAGCLHVLVDQMGRRIPLIRSIGR